MAVTKFIDHREQYRTYFKSLLQGAPVEPPKNIVKGEAFDLNTEKQELSDQLMLAFSDASVSDTAKLSALLRVSTSERLIDRFISAECNPLASLTGTIYE